MAKERCIAVKKALVDYIESTFPEFSYEGGTSTFYAFARAVENGIYDHILIEREFFNGKIYLIISEVASCYNKSWKCIPYTTVGFGTSLGALIAGKNHYPAGTGAHICDNNYDDLQIAFKGIGSDIERYVLRYFDKCHKDIQGDRQLTTIYSYMQAQFKVLNNEDIQSIEEKWVSDIQQELGYSTISDKMYNQIKRRVTILFKEEYNL